ncbi:MAG: hypothetical protein MPW14_08815 [Candidatus Manganitrophus sp.]|nr:MAG: hypothetical protein MPW14_08815 [Candidatus Manganitrophus sp.]
MRRIGGMILSALLLVGSGCTPEVPQPSQKNASPNIRASGAAAMLSKSEYDALSSEQKYAVADKLMGTLYKGVPVSDFFNIEAGLANPTLKRETNFLEETEAALSRPLEDKAVYLARIEEKYSFDEERQPIEYPLAMLFEFPVSRDYFHRWIAYRLANSILFSPGVGERFGRLHRYSGHPVPAGQDDGRGENDSRDRLRAYDLAGELAPLPLSGRQHPGDDRNFPRPLRPGRRGAESLDRL